MRINKIRTDNRETLDSFLETFRDFFLENGAAQAEILPVADLEFNEQKKEHDRHEESMYWPRVRYSKDSMPAMLGLFAKTAVFRVQGADHLHRGYEIASQAEAHCFYHGFHLATAFGTGNCRTLFCKEENACQALTRGRGCRHPLIARPSLEACGLDASEVRKAMGWAAGDNGRDFLGMVFVD